MPFSIERFVVLRENMYIGYGKKYNSSSNHNKPNRFLTTLKLERKNNEEVTKNF